MAQSHSSLYVVLSIPFGATVLRDDRMAEFAPVLLDGDPNDSLALLVVLLAHPKILVIVFQKLVDCPSVLEITVLGRLTKVVQENVDLLLTSPFNVGSVNHSKDVVTRLRADRHHHRLVLNPVSCNLDHLPFIVETVVQGDVGLSCEQRQQLSWFAVEAIEQRIVLHEELQNGGQDNLHRLVKTLKAQNIVAQVRHMKVVDRVDLASQSNLLVLVQLSKPLRIVVVDQYKLSDEIRAQVQRQTVSDCLLQMLIHILSLKLVQSLLLHQSEQESSVYRRVLILQF